MTVVRGWTRRIRAALGDVTQLGWFVAVVGVAAWVVGAWLGWREFLIVASAALLLWVIALALTLGSFDLEPTVAVEPTRVVVGERSAGELIVRNRRRRAVRGLRLELRVGRGAAAFAVAHLPGHGTSDELFTVPTHRRAIIPVGPVLAIKGDPLGMIRKTQEWAIAEEIYVHPRTVRLATVTAGQIRDLEGVTTAALSPSDIAFHTLRDYVAGDDLRHVHWKSSAKAGDLLVRQYNDTRRSHVAVLLATDLDEYASDDEFELAVSCAASVAVQAMRDDQTLTVIAGARELPLHDPVRLLDRFAGIEGRHGEGSIEQALQTARRVAADASVAVLCVGSRLDVAGITLRTRRAGTESPTVTLFADETATLGYLTVGDARFVHVPTLESLDRGLRAGTGAPA